jgi:hypothetical protein
MKIENLERRKSELKLHKTIYGEDPQIDDAIERLDKQIESKKSLMDKEMSSGKQDLWIHKEPKWGIKVKRFTRR